MVGTNVQNNWNPKEQSIIFDPELFFKWLLSFQYFWCTGVTVF